MIKKILQLALAIVAHAAMASASSVPPFEKGDLVAFAGDSITSGGSYHKYILTYWTTRHPEVGVRFRNKGIFSDFARGGIARLDTDILKEKPNKIVINFGMNDSGASFRMDLFGMDQPDEKVLQKRREAVAAYLYQPTWITVANARVKGLWKDMPVFVNDLAAISWQ
jgi:lysophospholipase L1-like esterase